MRTQLNSKAARQLVCLAALVLFTSTLLKPKFASSEVFYAKDEAMALAFPDVDEIETKTFILTNEQRTNAEKAARTRIDSNLFTYEHFLKLSWLF